jgi:hypothetical protein
MRRRLAITAGILIVASSAWYLWSAGFDRSSAHAATTSGSTEQKPSMNNGVIELRLGETGAAVVQRSQVPIKRGQTAGLAFYESSDIENRSEPTLRLLQGDRVLELPIARSILMTADEGRGHGIEDIDVSIKMPPTPKNINDEQVMDAYEAQVYELVREVISRVNSVGWKRYISPADPRIGGRESYDDSWNSEPDPSFVPALSDWKVLKRSDLSWYWYLPNAMLRVTYQRERHGRKPADSITVSMQSERLYLTVYDPKSEGNAEANPPNLSPTG